MNEAIGANVQPGEWKSPLSASEVARAGVTAAWPSIVGDDIWWVESRPLEGGRKVIVSKRVGDLLPAPFSASHSVHEYGGRSYLGITEANGPILYFVNKSDQRIYRKTLGSDPVALTPESSGSHRFAELIRVGNEIWSVREVTQGDSCTRELVAVSDDGSIRTLVSGHQFYAHPRVSPDGKLLTWVSWEHPNMPWDSSELFIAEIENGEIQNKRVVAGGNGNPVLSPEWLNDRELIYIDEGSGWWNPWLVDIDANRRQILAEDCEWGFPAWQLGYVGLAVLDDGRFVGIHGPVESRSLAIVDPLSRTIEELVSEYTYFAPTFAVAGNRLIAFAASPKTFPALVEFDVTSRKLKAVIRPNPLPIDASFAAPIEAIEIPAAGHDIKVILHRANHPDFKAAGPTPLLVQVHGGPTANSFAVAELEYLFWTTRGFTIADVNYGGSTGYGSTYRHLLDGKWGIVDYEDVITTVAHLIKIGIADPKRTFISGGSAGGFTVLNALIQSDLFAAGADHYGVAELSALAADTHDFESRYLDSMIGPYPERKDLYDSRSPLTHGEKLNTPLIIFQGLDDKVVPPSQSEALRDLCIAKGVTHKYFAFAGEGHGFVKAESIITSLEEELTFFGVAGGFTPSL